MAATPGKYVAAASANQDSTVLRAAPGLLRSLVAINTNAALRYLKLYDKATSPTSADTPVQVIPLPASATGAGVAVPIPNDGLYFAAGIGLRITTGAADNDANAATAGDVTLSYSLT